MYKDRILALADAIEKEALNLRFNMASMLDDEDYVPLDAPDAKLIADGELCGTVGCIAGSAVVLAAKMGLPATDRNVYGQARAFLGLDFYEAEGLFFPEEDGARWFARDSGSPNHITKERAAKVLRNFAETGSIDWKTR